jgi:integrase
MPAEKLTATFVENATVKPGAKKTVYWDEALPGFGLAVTCGGHRSYVVQYRAGHGRAGTDRRMTLRCDVLKLDDARKEAKAILGQVAKGGDPLGERKREEAKAENTLRTIVENFLDREGRNLRSAAEQRATFERLVFPRLGTRQIGEIKRSEIVSLLDKIEDENGPRMATLTLAYLRRAMNWHAARVDDFRSPIVRGMARGVVGKRDRILDDDELRALWRASLGWDHPYSHMLRFIVLTATRRDEAADMSWNEMEKADLWLIPAGRYKTKLDFEVPLSGAAMKTLNAVTRLSKRVVFTTDGENPISGFSKFKIAFEAKMLSELRKLASERDADPDAVKLERWTVHDLRRTARSLMTRAGVAPDHAERCLGHVIGGVRGVYDRHGYRDEKRVAFEALAGLVNRVVSPQSNIVELRSVG